VFLIIGGDAQRPGIIRPAKVDSRPGLLDPPLDFADAGEVSFRLEPRHDLLHGTPVGRFRPATQCVGEHLLGEAARERMASSPEQGAQLGRAPKGLTARQLAGWIDGMAAVVCAPGTDRVEVLEAEAQRVHPPVTGGAGRITPVALRAVAERAGALHARFFLEGLHSRWRWRRRRAQDV